MKIFDTIDYLAGGGIGLLVHKTLGVFIEQNSIILQCHATDMLAAESIKAIFTISTVVLSAIAMHFTRKFLNKK